MSRCSPFQPGTSRATRSPGINDDVKVLLIDDELTAEMYRLALAADGYEVVVGRDGEERLQMVIDEAPDFVDLDLRLPGPDGFEVLERLRADPATRASRSSA